MKKYDIYLEHENNGEELFEYIVKELSDGGDWVKAEDAETLEQLNKEMLEMLKECNDKFTLDDKASIQEGFAPIYLNIRSKIQSIIAKAEEV